MRREIETIEELDSLSQEWGHEDTAVGSPLVRRIEELPRLEDLGAAEIDWIVEGFLAKRAVHMFTSEAGGGKSTLLAAAGYAVSRGIDFIGRATSKSPVLILDAENPHPAIRERFGRLGIETHDDFRVWGPWVGEDPPAAGGAVVLEWVERCDPRPLIIVDSVIAFHPGAENDSNETRRFMAQYRNLTTMGATPVLLHHIGKSESSQDYRGSSDYKASIDIGYKLTNLGDPARLSNLELKPFKQRFTVAPALHLRYNNGVFSVDQSRPPKTEAERLRDLLKANQGVTKSEFEALATAQGLGRNRARTFLDNGVTAGTIQVRSGINNSKRHYWNGTPGSDAVEQ